MGTATRRAFENINWPVKTLDLRPCDLDGHPVDCMSDITSNDLNALLKGVAGVVHFAAVSRVCDAERNPEVCSHVNLYGVLRLLRAVAASGCRWFIFGSSREVYGEPSFFPVCETAALSPINHYGRIKAEGERLVTEYCRKDGVTHSVLRFSNVYGHPGDHPTRLLNSFIRNALGGKPLEIHGGGQVFDFTHVEDAANAVVMTAKHLHGGGASLPPMHVLPGEPTGIEDLAELVRKTAGGNSGIVYGRGRDYDVSRFYGDPSLIREKLGFSCKIFIAEGVKLAVRSFERCSG